MFKLVSKYKPSSDQPEAIKELEIKYEIYKTWTTDALKREMSKKD